MMIRKRFGRNAGYTLIEMVAAFSVLLVLAVASAQMLTAVTEIGISTTDRRQVRADVERLADQIRSDRRDADSVFVTDADDSDWKLTITTDGNAVDYQFDPVAATIRRSVSISEQNVATDRFVLTKKMLPTLVETDDTVQLWLRKSKMVTWMVEIGK